jgi:hypothetical protein
MPTNARPALVLCGLAAFATTANAQPCPPGAAQTLTLDQHHDFAHAGRSVAISGDLLAVGVHNDNRLGVGTGSVSVYRLDPATWQLQQELMPPRPSVGGWFGYSVAAHAGRLIVGAPYTVVAGQAVGSAHVFAFDPDLGWVEEAELLAPIPSADDRFGHSVAIHGDTAVVGVPRDDRAGATDAGSVMIFQRTDTGWTHTRTLFPPSTATAEAGWSVAFDGQTIVAGAPFDDRAFSNAGDAFVYTWSGAEWELLPGVSFSVQPHAAAGWSVAVLGGRVAVGAPDFTYPESDARGHVRIVSEIGGAWSYGGVSFNDFNGDNRFGTSLAMNGENLIVGDAGSGRAWIYGPGLFGGWAEPTEIVPHQDPLRFYGVSAAMTDTHAVIGADRLAGAAYAFGLACACPADFSADGQLNFFDLSAYLGAFGAREPRADLAAPNGVFNFFDVAAYLALYNAGCP